MFDLGDSQGTISKVKFNPWCVYIAGHTWNDLNRTRISSTTKH